MREIRPFSLTALAVGGKLDGTLVTGEGNYVNCYVQKPVEPSFALNIDALSLAATQEHQTYYRMEFAYKHDREEFPLIEFWVDRNEIRTEYELLIRLSNNYRPVVHDLRRKK